MTIPSKTWMRSREPSTTLTCTRTVSPEAISGTSARRCSSSTARTNGVTDMKCAPLFCQLPHGLQPDGLQFALSVLWYRGVRVWPDDSGPTEPKPCGECGLDAAIAAAPRCVILNRSLRPQP